MSTVLDGLYYSESHEWLKVEGEFGYIGITDYAQHQLGNVVYVDLPEVGRRTESRRRVRCSRKRKGRQRPAYRPSAVSSWRLTTNWKTSPNY